MKGGVLYNLYETKEHCCFDSDEYKYKVKSLGPF